MSLTVVHSTTDLQGGKIRSSFNAVLQCLKPFYTLVVDFNRNAKINKLMAIKKYQFIGMTLSQHTNPHFKVVMYFTVFKALA